MFCNETPPISLHMTTTIRRVKLWSVRTYHCLAVLSHDASVTTLLITHLLLVTCSLHGDIVFWNLNSNAPTLRRRMHRNVYIKQLAYTHSKFYGAGRYTCEYNIRSQAVHIRNAQEEGKMTIK